jgi:hypothetical protein
MLAIPQKHDKLIDSFCNYIRLFANYAIAIWSKIIGGISGNTFTGNQNLHGGIFLVNRNCTHQWEIKSGFGDTFFRYLVNFKLYRFGRS